MKPNHPASQSNPKNEVISQYELAVGQEGVHPFWPLVREGKHFLNNSKDGKDGMKKNDVLGTSLPRRKK